MRNSFSGLSLQELVAKRNELKKKLFQMRVDAVVGHISNPLELRTLRRMIARINTRIFNHDLLKEEGSEHA